MDKFSSSLKWGKKLPLPFSFSFFFWWGGGMMFCTSGKREFVSSFDKLCRKNVMDILFHRFCIISISMPLIQVIQN